MPSTMLDASVVICAHNPRPDYFARVLNGLRHQTLQFDRWELLIVDNESQLPLASRWDISWHPAARHLLERRLGLTWARHRGIQEASADLIIFVDDDNVLDETYLAEAIKLKHEWPYLGAWGSGSIRGELEVGLPESLRRHQSWLPLREVEAPRWSNLASYRKADAAEDVIPMGGGLCLRKNLAIAYIRLCHQSSIFLTDRQGDALSSAGDVEISWVCCSNGFGIGVFPELKLTHLIPQRRLSEDYFVRFTAEACLSEFLLDYKWRHMVPQSPYGLKTLLSVLKTILFYRGVDRRMRFAWLRALAKAKRIIAVDLRKNNGQISHPAVRLASKATVGSAREVSSQPGHPS
jgi:glycosyltransferase involved in cell wall biosynthesis